MTEFEKKIEEMVSYYARSEEEPAAVQAEDFYTVCERERQSRISKKKMGMKYDVSKYIFVTHGKFKNGVWRRNDRPGKFYTRYSRTYKEIRL